MDASEALFRRSQRPRLHPVVAGHDEAGRSHPAYLTKILALALALAPARKLFGSKSKSKKQRVGRFLWNGSKFSGLKRAPHPADDTKQMAHPMLFPILTFQITMSKPRRCLLHMKCMAAKIARGKSCRWHWEHLLREFGMGKYRPKNGVF